MILFIIGTVNSLDTQIKFKTSPERVVFFRFLDIDGKGTLPNGYFSDKTDSEGLIIASFSTDIENFVDLSIMMRDSLGNLIKFPNGDSLKIFKSIKTGWNYYVDATTNDIEIIKLDKIETYNNSENNISNDITGSVIVNNEINSTNNSEVINDSLFITNNNTNELINNSLELNNTEPVAYESSGKKDNVSQNRSKTPFAFFSKNNNSRVYGTIIIAAVLLLIVIILIYIIIRKNQSKIYSDNIKVVKYSEKFNTKKYGDDKELYNAEVKFEQAKEELNEIKQKKLLQIKETEKKLRQDKLELENIKKQRF
jgi:hypothetical protein